MFLTIDWKTLEKEVYRPKESDTNYKASRDQYKDVLKLNDPRKIDDAVVAMETEAIRVTYSKGFHDGMKFIMNVIAGEEVVKL